MHAAPTVPAVPAVPASLRLLNQRRLLELVLLGKAGTRAALADATGMSRPTAGRIIDDLIEAGVVEEREVAQRARGRGRPGREVVPGTTARFLLVEVGVRRTLLAAVPLAALMPDGAADDDLWTVSFATPRAVDTLVSRVVAARSRLALRRPWAFALSLPGVVDERTGLSHYNPHLHWTEGANLQAALEKALAIPGCAVQEIRALALGHLVSVPEDRDFLLVDADDGIGAAAVIRGQLFDGALPSTVELGHTRVPGNGRPCGCGSTGCLETLAARPGILATFARAARKPRAGWPDFLAALGRDPMPRWLAGTLDACGDVISGALNVLGLTRVVLTGAFGDLAPAAVAHISRAVSRGSLAARFGAVNVGVTPRRRARGLLAALVDRRLIPTADWSAPCLPSERA